MRAFACRSCRPVACWTNATTWLYLAPSGSLPQLIVVALRPTDFSGALTSIHAMPLSACFRWTEGCVLLAIKSLAVTPGRSPDRFPRLVTSSLYVYVPSSFWPQDVRVNTLRAQFVSSDEPKPL
jgi:hypothetical protein